MLKGEIVHFMDFEGIQNRFKHGQPGMNTDSSDISDDHLYHNKVIMNALKTISCTPFFNREGVV